jgi:hypothetical protein
MNEKEQRWGRIARMVDVPAEDRLESRSVEKSWHLVTLEDRRYGLIPGWFNSEHHHIASGIGYILPPGVDSVWSNTVRGIGDYIGQLLVSGSRETLEDIMHHPPKRCRINGTFKLNGREKHDGL